MIISASRRTDIPAFYWEWFQKRLQEQYVLVRNPLNLHQVSRISLRPEVVDGLVFWTKNPEPMLKQLSVLDAYAYYFQFMLNAYAADVEAALPPLAVRIEIFRQLAQKIGAERMIWRYDPILLSARYDLQYHAAVFEELAAQLAGSTKKCIISFLDYYPKIKAGLHQAGLRGLSEDEQRRLAAVMSQTARQYGLQLETCAEAIELADLGIGHASCIDAELLGRVSRCRLDTVKDKKYSAVNAAVPPVSISAPITPVCMAAFIVMPMTAADSCSRLRLEIAVRRCCAVSWSLRIRLRKETCGRCGHCRQSFLIKRLVCDDGPVR